MSSNNLPSPEEEPRIALSEVCKIAKLSRATIKRRIDKGTFPRPVDRGRERLFDRKAAYEALGISLDSGNYGSAKTINPWLKGAHALSNNNAA